MTSITIGNLNDGFAHNLRTRAERHGRSMEEEAREILKETVGEARPPRNLAAAIRARVEPWGGMELELPSRGPMREPPTFD